MEFSIGITRNSNDFNYDFYVMVKQQKVGCRLSKAAVEDCGYGSAQEFYDNNKQRLAEIIGEKLASAKAPPIKISSEDLR